MPIPIIGAVIPKHLAFLNAIGTGMQAGGSQAFLEPARRYSLYTANTIAPNVYPPPDAIIDSYLRGHLAFEDARYLLNAHGIDTMPEDGTGKPLVRRVAWSAFANSRRPRPDVQELLTMRARGFFGNPNEFYRLLSWTAAEECDWRAFVESLNYALTPIDAVHAWRRKLFADDSQFARYLRSIGIVSDLDQYLTRELAKEIPGISDLIRMLVRESFDGKVVKDGDYMRDFPPAILKWAEAMGFGWQLGDPSWIREVGIDPTWAHLYWAAHWERMSPTQSAEAMYRLRPGRHAGGVTWTKAQHLELLKIKDYAPKDQAVLSAISARRLDKRDLKRAAMYAVPPFDNPATRRNAMIEYAKDYEFEQQEAEVLADSLLREVDVARYAKFTLLTSRKIQSGYFAGILDDTTAEGLLLTAGYSLSEAQLAVQTWAYEFALERVRKLTKGIKRNYMLGDYTDVDAINALVRAGVLATRANEYITVWRQEYRQGMRVYAITTLTDWLLHGIIDEAEFRARLSSRGWIAADIDRVILHALAKVKAKAPPSLKVPHGPGGSRGLQPPGELTRGEVKQLYLAGDIGRPEAERYLADDGLLPGDRTLLLNLWSR